MFYADLHLHSKYSRATAKNADVVSLAASARRKGIALLGTGDFTHPGWRDELREALVPAGDGVYRLRPELERVVSASLPAACAGETRFVLSVEISTIYKRGERTRKVHHVVLLPNFEAVEALVGRLSRIGNLASDGRPILGLDSRDLLEMVLESSRSALLIPAHIWTPWFSALGSQSGFDSIDECYGDLSSHIFAVETGLSSDPAMNWRVSSLDRFRLVSSSDAHSPPMLGREACMFDGPMDFPGLRAALERGEGYVGTVEFFPEEGKYHLDGHRGCGVRLEPSDTARLGGRCPSCGRPLTVGVLSRVCALADRAPEAPRPSTAGLVRSLVPLRELLGELHGTGAASKRVLRSHEALLGRLGPELELLASVPLEEVERHGSALLAEALRRLRAGEVSREAGYDGEYGVIRLFSPGELASLERGRALFGADLDRPADASRAAPRPRKRVAASDQPSEAHAGAAVETAGAPAPPPVARTLFEAAPHRASVLDGLDPHQRAAAEIVEGPLCVVAGPGSGKTRTLTHRIAHLVLECAVPPEACLTITFTRRAAAEMQERLDRLIPGASARVPIATFHRLGLTILEEHYALAGFDAVPRVADPAACIESVAAGEGISTAKARRLLARIARARRARDDEVPSALPAELQGALDRHRARLRVSGRVDLEDLVELPIELLTNHPEIVAALRLRWRWLSVDEYQDVDARQVRLVRLLAPRDGNVCVIGDPDQAIYGFRGADVRLFAKFREHFPAARQIDLRRNYRSDGLLVRAAAALIAAADGRPRPAEAQLPDGRRAVVHEAPTDRAEAEHVVATIERLIGGHTFFALDSGRSDGQPSSSFSFGDFAVLYRTEAQLAPLAEALRRAGMPFRRRSHAPLGDEPAVRQLCDALWERATGLFAPVPARPVLAELREVAAALVRAGAEPEPIEAALLLLGPLAAGLGTDAARFVREVELGANLDSWDPRADAVSLMTLHASKGLEFPVVFLVGCEAGILPLVLGHADRVDLAEERRLLYVGMTRARERLILSWARRRTWRGRVREQSLSPLLGDIATALCEQSSTELAPRALEAPSPQLELFRP